DLAGHGVEVEAGLEAADLAEAEREEVEEERSLGLGGERDHLALRLLVRIRVDELQIRRLPAQAGAVVDDLAVDLARAVVDEAHRRRPRLLTEEVVDVVVGDLRERRPGAWRLDLLQQALEDLVQLV